MIEGANTKGFDISKTKQIVYAPQTGTYAGDLLVWNETEQGLEGNPPKVVSSPASSGIFWSEPRWATGEQIIGHAEGGIYSINVDGSHLRRLSTFGDWPVMSINGYLAFTTDNNDLYVISPVKNDEEFGTLTHIAVPGPAGSEDQPSVGAYSGAPLLMSSKGGLREYSLQTLKQTGFYPKLTDPTFQAGVNGDAGCGSGYAVEYTRPNEKTQEGAAVHPCSSLRIQKQFYASIIPPGIAPTKEQLLNEFTPILRYDFQESYRAISPIAETDTYKGNEGGEYLYADQLKRGSKVIADSLVGKSPSGTTYKPTGYFPLRLENLGVEYPVAIGSEGRKAKETDFLDEHNGTEQEDAGVYAAQPETARAYGHAVETAGGIWLQYWFYYYYNLGQFGVDDHEGDWEMVQVFLTKNSGYLRDKMVFSQHSHSVVCQRGEYQTEGKGPGFGGHPVVHVGRSGHASYPFGGLYETDTSLANESAHFNALQESPVPVKLFYGEPYGEPGTETPHVPNWLSWPGIWGASTGENGTGKSPRGPAFHGAQWSEPEVWAANAKPCLFNQVNPETKEEPGQQNSSAKSAAGPSAAADTGADAVAPQAAQTGASLVLSSPQLTNGKLSVIVDATQLKEAGVEGVIVAARGLTYEHPPQTVDLKEFIGKKRVTFPIAVAAGKTQEITASAILPKERVIAKALTK